MTLASFSSLPRSVLRGLTISAAVGFTLAACAGTPSKPVAGNDPALSAVRWELTGWTGHTVPHGDNGEPVILNFDMQDGVGRVSGRAGCNQFSAPYSIRAAGQLTIVEAVTTRMACPPPAMRFEADFLDKLQAVNNYKINGPVLEMKTVDGQTLSFYQREKPSAAAKIKFVYVASQKVPCSAGVMRTTCLQIREHKEDPWLLWYGNIVGFNFEPGVAYRLRILEEPVRNPPADASSIKWTLDMIVEQEVVKQ
jgi:heat shock protein HslJ